MLPDFEDIVLKTWPDGTRLLLGDIATVAGCFRGRKLASPCSTASIRLVSTFSRWVKQDIIDTADAVKDYLEQKRAVLPKGVKLDAWQDSTYYLKDQLGMMSANLLMGAVLVFVVLALFLEIKLAFWVMMGIPICFLGALALINTPLIDSNLNMLSIFGFIVALGILVDDAIITGESAYSEQELHGHSVHSVVTGVYKVATPATFGVLTTIVAFAPTLFVQGVFGAFPEACGWVVVLCLSFSLLESKWILPAHLAHSKPASHPWLLWLNRLQEYCNRQLRQFRRLPLHAADAPQRGEPLPYPRAVRGAADSQRRPAGRRRSARGAGTRDAQRVPAS